MPSLIMTVSSKRLHANDKCGRVKDSTTTQPFGVEHWRDLLDERLTRNPYDDKVRGDTRPIRCDNCLTNHMVERLATEEEQNALREKYAPDLAPVFAVICSKHGEVGIANVGGERMYQKTEEVELTCGCLFERAIKINHTWDEEANVRRIERENGAWVFDALVLAPASEIAATRTFEKVR